MKPILTNGFLVCYAKPNHPYNVAKIVVCEYFRDRFDDYLYETLPFKEPDSVKSSVKKRRAEFLAGRVAAVSALRLMGENTSEIPIGEHRNPVWPTGITGSITHNSNTALAIVANKTDAKFVGIDCEDILSLDVAESINNMILTANELSYLKESDIDINFFCTLIFSAKESLFKAMYPYIHRYLEFDVANVFDICFVNKIFKISLIKKITSELDVGKCFIGHFEFDFNYVTKMIVCN